MATAQQPAHHAASAQAAQTAPSITSDLNEQPPRDDHTDDKSAIARSVAAAAEVPAVSSTVAVNSQTEGSGDRGGCDIRTPTTTDVPDDMYDEQGKADDVQQTVDRLNELAKHRTTKPFGRSGKRTKRHHGRAVNPRLRAEKSMIDSKDLSE